MTTGIWRDSGAIAAFCSASPCAARATWPGSWVCTLSAATAGRSDGGAGVSLALGACGGVLSVVRTGSAGVLLGAAMASLDLGAAT
jgi:hypothetical protein